MPPSLIFVLALLAVGTAIVIWQRVGIVRDAMAEHRAQKMQKSPADDKEQQ